MRIRTVVVAAVVAVSVSGCVVVRQGSASSPPARDSGSGGGAGYSFVHTRSGGEPVRWSTCEPIRYVVRPDNEPEGARRLLEESLRLISAATGLGFEAAGTTDEAPGQRRRLYQPDRYGDRWAPVLVAYSSPDEDPRLTGQAAGYGGPAYVRVARGTPRYVSGAVVFDVEQLTANGGDEHVRAVMLHELSHLVGLAHVKDRGQLMNPVLYGDQVTDLQQGDLAGLEEVGDGECYDPVEPRALRAPD